MVEEGKTDKEITKKLGIGLTSWKKYKAECSELRDVLEEAKDNKNQEVEQALFKCCKGYTYYEEVVTKVKEEYEGSQGQTLIKERVEINSVKKYSKPELAAQKYWLNNRKSKDWKEDPNKAKTDKEIIKLKKKEVAMKDLGI